MPRTEGRIYTPKEAFGCEYNGVPLTLRPQTDLIREGHELLDMYPELFELAHVRYDVEEASAAPGTRRAR